MHNVRILCAQAGIDEIEPYYISRSYLTRHGAGPLPGERDGLSFRDDTNLPNEYQGTMRFAPVDVDALLARIKTDSSEARLVITHCDQLDAPCPSVATSHGPTRLDVELISRR